MGRCVVIGLLTALALGTVAFYGLRSVYVCASLALSWRHYREHAAHSERGASGAPRPLDVIIPAFEEQAVMPATMRHYAMLAKNWLGLRVWVVTAAREQARAIPGTVSTDAVCRELASALNDSLGRNIFEVVCCPGTGGRRASQLNYALDAIARSASGYVAVFDADARPDERLGSQFTAAAASGPSMIQQLQLPAFDTLAVHRRSALMCGQDLYALRRVLGIEYRRILVARWCRRRTPAVLCAAVRPMVYGVGSGLVVRVESLEQIGRFQEPHDDLAVGHRLSMAGAEITVLPSVNIVEPYRDVASMARAFSSVAFGNAATVADYRHARKHPSMLGHGEQLLLLWRALADGVLWATGPYLVLAALVACLVGGGVDAITAGAAVAVNGLIEPAIALRCRTLLLAAVRLPDADRLADFHEVPLRRGLCTYLMQPALTSTGPWLLGARWIAAKLRRRPIAFTKTAHLGATQERHDG
jgi:hypothetical protein